MKINDDEIRLFNGKFTAVLRNGNKTILSNLIPVRISSLA